MEKILNGRMYYIDLEVAEYFMEYLMIKEMDELRDVKWHKSVVRNGKYNDGELIDDMFSISYGFNVGDRLGRGATEIDLDLCIPMIYKNIEDFSEDLYWFLNMEYGFDLFEWGNQYGFTFEESNILFDLCHEIGHLKDFIEQTNKYGYFKSYADDEYNLYKLHQIIDEEARFLGYRRLKAESTADQFAIEFLKKHGKNFKEIIRKLLTEMTEEEVEKVRRNLR